MTSSCACLDSTANAGLAPNRRFEKDTFSQALRAFARASQPGR